MLGEIVPKLVNRDKLIGTFDNPALFISDVIMDIEVLNELGYIEVIVISIWIGLMYYGKCWVDSRFK